MQCAYFSLKTGLEYIKGALQKGGIEATGSRLRGQGPNAKTVGSRVMRLI